MDLVICLLFVAYLFPFAVAARYEHERLGRILVANLVFGGTAIGWLAVLGWARTRRCGRPSRSCTATCGALPPQVTACTPAPPPGTTGPVTWSFSGALAPGASGTVTYSVTIVPP
ncbi:MAG: superinfection immunity protein [Deltaproteobacteria bacterium]|nr:superinfection immunity protein [Deltaproteobacteria bacterium]